MGKQHLSLEQRLGLKMSPKQMQLMRLLQVPSAELVTSIREEMENNPALEEAAEDEHNSTDETNQSDEDGKEDILEDYFNEDEVDSYKERSVQQEEKYRRPAVEQASFQEQVLEQFRLLNTDSLQQIIGEVIIGNLDDDGYLSRSIEAIVNDLAFSQNISVSQSQVEDVLKIIQTLEPSGIGARSLRECLQIQLQRYNLKDASDNILALAQKIVSNDARFDEFTSRKYDALIKRFKVSPDEFKEAVSIITHLNPKPGGGTARLLNPIVIPDFTINVFENEITVSLNNDYVPDLRVNPAYQQMLGEYSSKNNSANKNTVSFIKQKIENARSFIDLIKERQNTLLSVMQTIVNLQRVYFLTGERSQLKPMILKDVAEITNLDISTVSRITSNKYAQTPYGIILLKEFFSQALQNEEGNNVSSIEVKDALKKIIETEDPQKPFTDDTLVAEMKKNGYTISRRTITKYRELLGIPVARLRRGIE
ncbi:MAG: RNA polymerase factor sigma-54 [Bacteroidales bacterium]|jgi:RNA polymerase sigma-54 factor|nr:RNA polymerase factor sigma-54 [Bacteroidales bacterium]